MAEAKTYSICFRLRRTIVEDAFVRVSVTDEVFKAYPDKDGKVRLDTEMLIKAAIMLGDDPSTRWLPEDRPTIQLHPWQIPPPEGR